MTWTSLGGAAPEQNVGAGEAGAFVRREHLAGIVELLLSELEGKKRTRKGTNLDFKC